MGLFLRPQRCITGRLLHQSGQRIQHMQNGKHTPLHTIWSLFHKQFTATLKARELYSPCVTSLLSKAKNSGHEGPKARLQVCAPLAQCSEPLLARTIFLQNL